MAEYINAPIVVDADDLKSQVYTYLQSVIPGWQPADGQLDVWLIEAFCEIGAQIGQTASDVVRAIFRWYGANLVGIPPIDALAAVGTVTITLIDDLGHTIPAGTSLAFDLSDGSTLVFTTDSDAVVDTGSTSISTVSITASDPGADGNGLSGTATLVDFLDFIDTVTVEGTTSGGADAETDDDYFDRLADELRLLAPRPILPEDFATFARNTAGIARATAIDGLNATDGTTGNERMVTVAVIDDAGNPVSTTIKDDLQAALQAKREVNFVVYVIDPTYTSIDVTFTATAWPGYDVATAQQQAIDGVTAYISPGTWGQPQGGETREWLSDDPTVRYLKLAQAIEGVEGIRHVDTLTLCVTGGTMGTADVTLAGNAPLPKAGTISGTVS